MSLSRLLLLAAICGVSLGCQSITQPPLTATDATIAPTIEPMGQAPPFEAVEVASRASPPSPTQSIASLANHTAPAMADDDAVLRELQTIVTADPTAAGQLVAQLQTVNPSMRPLVAQQFRSSWQYHRELTGQDGTRGAALPTDREVPGASAGLPRRVTGQAPSGQATDDAGEPAAATSSFAYDPEKFNAPPPDLTPVANYGTRPIQATHTTGNPAPLRRPSRADAPATTALTSGPSIGWQELVDQAIAELAADTPGDPRSTEDAYAHARLRLLQLVAGHDDEALAPIPGLTPTEQGYWSNQLFALSTLLDHEQQANDEERAALAGSQLDDAAARLAELSALAVRNAAFAKQVFGFGDYDPLDKAVFQPGQAVTLYAEVENYRSESTEKGFHTSLATSYEVLDKNGHRVEGGEFATVDDYCKRRRRDFYIEYTIELPSRIYPSDYQLRLMIRDRLGGKIGTATVKFEIAE